MIKIIKLHNNTEIIGELINEDNTYIYIDNPFTINYMFSPKSERPIIGLLRYIPFAEQRDIRFHKDDVMHYLTARKSMASYYHVTLITHEKEVDESIDNELESIADLEMMDQDTSTDMLAAMLEQLNPNKSIH